MTLSLFLLAYTCSWFPGVGYIRITQNHPYSCGLATGCHLFKHGLVLCGGFDRLFRWDIMPQLKGDRSFRLRVVSLMSRWLRNETSNLHVYALFFQCRSDERSKSTDQTRKWICLRCYRTGRWRNDSGGKRPVNQLRDPMFNARRSLRSVDEIFPLHTLVEIWVILQTYKKHLWLAPSKL